MSLLKPLESIPILGGGIKWFDTQMHGSLFQHSVFGAIVFLVVSNTDVYKQVKGIIFDVTGYRADGNTMHLIHAVVFAVIMYFGSLFILAPMLTEGADPNATPEMVPATQKIKKDTRNQTITFSNFTHAGATCGGGGPIVRSPGSPADNLYNMIFDSDKSLDDAMDLMRQRAPKCSTINATLAMHTHTASTRDAVWKQIGRGRDGESNIDTKDNKRLVILWSTYKVPSQTPGGEARTWTKLDTTTFNSLMENPMFSVQLNDVDITKWRNILAYNALDKKSRLSVAILTSTEASNLTTTESANTVTGL